ncbi:MAG: SPOR domain-containing protein [Prevotellaceae bacterium]|jgi:nucleoid DNA-binding protein|nr:SPOR domain-containing protein [Prevotellaceae bacterium]
MSASLSIIGDLLAQLLRTHNRVSLPGLGAFVTEYKPAAIIKNGKGFLPPTKTVAFRTSELWNDGFLEKEFAAKAMIPEEESKRQIAEFVRELDALLREGKRIEFPDFGTMRITADGDYSFKKDEDINLLPESFGLMELDVMPLPADTPPAPPVSPIPPVPPISPVSPISSVPPISPISPVSSISSVPPISPGYPISSVPPVPPTPLSFPKIEPMAPLPTLMPPPTIPPLYPPPPVTPEPVPPVSPLYPPPVKPEGRRKRKCCAVCWTILALVLLVNVLLLTLSIRSFYVREAELNNTLKAQQTATPKIKTPTVKKEPPKPVEVQTPPAEVQAVVTTPAPDKPAAAPSKKKKAAKKAAPAQERNTGKSAAMNMYHIMAGAYDNEKAAKAAMQRLHDNVGCSCIVVNTGGQRPYKVSSFRYATQNEANEILDVFKRTDAEFGSAWIERY